LAENMLLLTRTFDLLEWLLPKTEKFPRAYRYSLTRHLADAALDLQEKLFLARKRRGAERVRLLMECDAHLDTVRLYLRLAHRWHWLTDGQYEHVSRLVAEIGKLLGGWVKRPEGGQKTGAAGTGPGGAQS
jgi:hypothetical protein